MTEWWKRYLLGGVALAPETGGGTPDEQDLDPQDDEQPLDPADEDSNEEVEDEEGADEDDEQDASGAGGPQPESRGRRQYGELRRQRREEQAERIRLAEENAALTRRLNEIQRSAQHVETPQQRQERYDRIVDPEERVLARWRDEQAVTNQQTINTQFQLIDTIDRTQYDSLSSPLAKKLAPEVERRLSVLRQQGQNVPRKAILALLIGERALENAGKQQGNSSRQRQQARPANARGDVRVDRQARRAAPGSAADFEARFGDVAI